MVVGFKAMNLNMTCRDYQFEIGKTYDVGNDKPLQTCDDSGFHFCLKLDDVFDHYPFNKCRLFEVEALCNVITEGNKSATKKLRIVRELTQDDLNSYEFDDIIHDLWFKDRTDVELLKYKNHDRTIVRVLIVEKLKELKKLDLMYEAFKDDKSWVVRENVLECMENNNLMYETFKDDESWIIRESVVERMDDLSLMYHTFKDDSHPFVRAAVVDRMTDLELMYQTFKDDKASEVRYAVNDRMNLA